MKTLLHLDSSPLGQASLSRELSTRFVANWTAANADGKVLRRDLNADSIPPIDGAWIGAVFTPEENRTAAQREALAISDQFLAEVAAADEWVIGVPMHNFGIPGVLKLWIDQIVRVGKTFAYVDGAPTGLLKNKKATFLIASGGVYEPGSAYAPYDFVGPYLRSIFGFIGVTETVVLHAGGAAAIRAGKIDRETFLKPHLETIDGWFKAAI